jgi:hypothetical protein
MPSSPVEPSGGNWLVPVIETTFLQAEHGPHRHLVSLLDLRLTSAPRRGYRLCQRKQYDPEGTSWAARPISAIGAAEIDRFQINLIELRVDRTRLNTGSDPSDEWRVSC